LQLQVLIFMAVGGGGLSGVEMWEVGQEKEEEERE